LCLGPLESSKKNILCRQNTTTFQVLRDPRRCATFVDSNSFWLWPLIVNISAAIFETRIDLKPIFAHFFCHIFNLFIFFFLGRTKTGSLICPFPLLVAQMVPLNLKNLGVYEKALFDKTNAGINFLLAYIYSRLLPGGSRSLLARMMLRWSVDCSEK
jgi:hypothetical protein